MTHQHLVEPHLAQHHWPEDAPVLVTGDPALADELARLGAAAGVAPVILTEPADALRRWPIAPLILVGVDRAAQVAALAPSRRPGVHVIAVGDLPDVVFRDAVVLGAETVSSLPASETWLVELLTDTADGSSSVGTLIGVVGGSGGAGASVFAAALAEQLSRSGRTLLVDADTGGAGLDHVVGTDDAKGVRWEGLGEATGRLSARALRDTLPGRGDLSVLSWSAGVAPTLPPFVLREVLSAGRRGFGHVVVDLPRYRNPITEETVARCDHVVMVCRLTVPGVVAATRVAALLPPPPRTCLVTRGTVGGVTPQEAEKALGLPLVGAMGHQRGLDEAIGLGAGPLRARRGTLARTVGAVAAALGDGGHR